MSSEETEDTEQAQHGDTETQLGIVSLRAIPVTACVASALLVPRQNPPPFKSAIQTVAIYPTVRDRDGHLVTDLTK